MPRHFVAVRELWSDESAAVAAESVLMAMLIGVAAVAAVASFGLAVRTLLSNGASALQ